MFFHDAYPNVYKNQVQIREFSSLFSTVQHPEKSRILSNIFINRIAL